MVGDHFETDIAGAKGAGLWTIWFNPTGNAIPPNGEGKADAVISSHSELENALLMISGRASRIRH